MGKPVTGELVRMSAPDLEVMNPASREVAVSAFLEDARNSLARALEDTGPHAVAQIKAEIAVVAEMTKQLNLSKECRDDATEMVRRAEYSLGKAIRKGQEDGTVRTHGEGSRPNSSSSRKSSPYDFATKIELSGKCGDGILGLADSSGSDEQFEEALSEAKSDGNLSRANVVRKLKGEEKPEQKGRGNERRQVNALENAYPQLRGILDGLTFMFDGGFEKTLTPEIAADYARKLRAEQRRLGTLISQINDHGKANQS